MDVLGDEFGFLPFEEVSAARSFGPAIDPVRAFGPLTRRFEHVVWASSPSGRPSRPTDQDSPTAVAADSDLAQLFVEVQCLTHCEYYQHPDDLSYACSIYDETVVIELNDGSGFVPAVVVSDDEAVLSWAEQTFERYRSEAELIGPNEFLGSS